MEPWSVGLDHGDRAKALEVHVDAIQNRKQWDEVLQAEQQEQEALHKQRKEALQAKLETMRQNFGKSDKPVAPPSETKPPGEPLPGAEPQTMEVDPAVEAQAAAAAASAQLAAEAAAAAADDMDDRLAEDAGQKRNADGSESQSFASLAKAARKGKPGKGNGKTNNET